VGAPPSRCASARVLGHRADGPTRRGPRGSPHEGRLPWGKHRQGGPLARGRAPPSQERLGCRGEPGTQTRPACGHPPGAARACLWAVPPAQRRRTVRRLDGGLGPAAHRHGARWPGEPGLATGSRGTRAPAFARAVLPWDARRTGARGRAPAPTPRRADRRTQTVVWPWPTAQDTSRPRRLSTAVRAPAVAARAAGDADRAALAAELKAAPGGRPRPRRRQPRRAAQDALVWRTDGAHPLRAWTRAGLVRDSPGADAGLDRRGNERVPIPGPGVIEAGPSVKRRRQTAHPRATPMRVCLARLGDRCGTPGILRKS
jgi:hypothetical protein